MTMRRFWSMRESAQHATALTLQSERMQRLQDTMETGHAALFGQLTSYPNTALLENDHAHQTPATDSYTVASRREKIRPRRGKHHKLRFVLPSWFVNCVWEVGMHNTDGVRTIEIYPINRRRSSTLVFDSVRAGDIEPVRKYIASGQLSFRDHADDYRGSSLLEVRLESTTLACAGKLRYPRWQPAKVTSIYVPFFSCRLLTFIKIQFFFPRIAVS